MAYVRINSDGSRDIEHSITKPPGTFRIAILGDSYAEGLQISLEKLFWKVLEDRLRGCKHFEGKKIEALNFGVSGYGTGRELLMLRKKVWKYEPNIVVLAYLTGNDVRDNSKELNRVDYIPYFNLDEQGNLVVDQSYLTSAGYKSRQGVLATIMYSYGNHIKLLQLANQIRHVWNQHFIQIGNGTTAGEPGLDSNVYLPPETKVWQDAWAVTEALLRQIKREVDEHGARFLLVTLSNAIQVHPDESKRKEFMDLLGVNNLFYPDMRIRDFARKHGIDVSTLAPRMVAITKGKDIYVHGFENSIMGSGHWNAIGHRFAGEMIAEHICETTN